MTTAVTEQAEPTTRLKRAARIGAVVASVALIVIGLGSGWLAYLQCTIPIADTHPPIPGRCDGAAYQWMVFGAVSFLMGAAGIVFRLRRSAR